MILSICSRMVLCVRQLSHRSSERWLGKSGHAHVSKGRWRTVAGNARRGNPRDANRDAQAEKQGDAMRCHLIALAPMETLGVQRQKSYPRARPCPWDTPIGYLTGESLDPASNLGARYMVATDFACRRQLQNRVCFVALAEKYYGTILLRQGFAGCSIL